MPDSAGRPEPAWSATARQSARSPSSDGPWTTKSGPRLAHGDPLHYSWRQRPPGGSMSGQSADRAPGRCRQRPHQRPGGGPASQGSGDANVVSDEHRHPRRLHSGRGLQDVCGEPTDETAEHGHPLGYAQPARRGRRRRSPPRSQRSGARRSSVTVGACGPRVRQAHQLAIQRLMFARLPGVKITPRFCCGEPVKPALCRPTIDRVFCHLSQIGLPL